MASMITKHVSLYLYILKVHLLVSWMNHLIQSKCTE